MVESSTSISGMSASFDVERSVEQDGEIAHERRRTLTAATTQRRQQPIQQSGDRLDGGLDDLTAMVGELQPDRASVYGVAGALDQAVGVEAARQLGHIQRLEPGVIC